MIRTLAYTQDGRMIENLSIAEVLELNPTWYWIDFQAPTMEEAAYLEKLGFHRLAIKDCLHYLQRPKFDYYDSYTFYVLQVLNKDTWKPEEIDLFAGRDYIVTFHYQAHEEIDEAWERIKVDTSVQPKGTPFITLKIIDKIVDYYFPIAQGLEDHITMLEEKTRKPHAKLHTLMREVFKIRGQLLAMRHTIWPMRDLLYRILNSERLHLTQEERRQYKNIHDHLERLSQMVESSRDMTSDIRDNYLSLNSYRMNSAMMTLTVITVIFMPLTFIAGIYGMNFEHMPELKWKYGYFITLGLMGFIGTTMYLWFRKKGWFEKE
jgi:magnesium transporter